MKRSHPLLYKETHQQKIKEENFYDRIIWSKKKYIIF